MGPVDERKLCSSGYRGLITAGFRSIDHANPVSPRNQTRITRLWVDLAIILASGCQTGSTYEDNGYINQDIVEDIRDEQARIKAISAYEYALPIVGLEQWYKGFLQQAKYGDWLIYENRATKIPIITANTTTPYVMSFADLSEGNYYKWVCS